MIHPKDIRRRLCLEAECTFDAGCGCLEALNAFYNDTIEECAKAAEDFETQVPGTAWIMDGIAAAIRNRLTGR